MYDSSSNLNDPNETCLTKVRRERERETQSVLREIRERSRDRSYNTEKIDSSTKNDLAAIGSSRFAEAPSNCDTISASKEHRRKSSIPNIRITVDKQNGRIYHTRNKSIERCCDIDDDNEQPRAALGDRRSSLSMSRSAGMAKDSQKPNETPAINFTDEILNELVQRSKEHQRSKSANTENTEPKVDVETTKKIKVKTKDGKKLKTKVKSTEKLEKQSSTVENNEISNGIETVTLPLPKSMSKLSRPKSYPNKDEIGNEKMITESIVAIEKVENPVDNTPKQMPNDIDAALRPKNYTNSKLTPPKEIGLKSTKKTSTQTSQSTTITSNGNTRNAITAVMEKFMEKSAERLSPAKSLSPTKAKGENGEVSPPKVVKKKVKVVKKASKSDQSSPSKEASPKKLEDTSNETSPVKERKSPEKKLKSGFLYSIGQKFEKMRENSKNKEKEKKIQKSNEALNDTANKVEVLSQPSVETPNDLKSIETLETVTPRKIKEKEEIKQIPQTPHIPQMAEISIRKIELQPVLMNNTNSTAAKSEQRKSRIDAMIRNLRERSVPHTIRAESRESELATESGLIKRAVSVEDIPNGMTNFHKCNVNKVLGLFRRIEREQQLQKQQQQYSSGSGNGQDTKERPKSGGFVSKLKKSGRPYYTGAKSDTIVTLTDQFEKQFLSDKANQTFTTANNTKIPLLRSSFNSKTDKNVDCLDCCTNEFKDTSVEERKRSLSQTPDAKRFSNGKPFEPITKPQVPTLTTDNNGSDAISEKERIRNNRKGLVLDLGNEQFDLISIKKLTNNNSKNNNLNGAIVNNNHYQFNTNGNAHVPHCNGLNSVNNNYSSNHVNGSNNNNYNFHGHSDRNSGASFDLSTNYSSDNRSNRDDCESTSTFLSPTEEPELCFDDWSACSGLYRKQNN